LSEKKKVDSIIIIKDASSTSEVKVKSSNKPVVVEKRKLR